MKTLAPVLLFSIMLSSVFALPDLVMSLNITPANSSNVTYLLRVTTTNIGNSTALNSTTAVWVGTIRYRAIAVPPLFPGQSHQFYWEVHCSSINSSLQVTGRADNWWVVQESNEGNNAAVPVTMQACPPGVLPDMPDLVASLNMTASNQTNFTYVIALTTRNIGNGTAGPSRSAVWSVPYDIGWEAFDLPALEPGESHVDYWIVHCGTVDSIIYSWADYDYDVEEWNEGNNQANQLVMPVCSTQPDLVVLLNITPEDEDNTTYRLGVTTRNIGNWTAGNSTTYVSASRWWTIRVPQLEPGEGYENYSTLHCQSQSTPIMGWANYENDVSESNWTNNVASIVMPACSVMPDLVSSLEIVGPANETNVTYLVMVTTTNIGNYTAAESVTGVTQMFPIFPIADIGVPALAAGGSHQFVLPVHCSENQSVLYSYADKWHNVTESNETNNRGSLVMPSCPPLPDLDADLNLIGNYTENGTLYHRLELAVTNIGQLDAPASITHVNDSLNTTDMMIETPALSPGQTYARIVDIQCLELWDIVYATADANFSIVEVDDHFNNDASRVLAPCPPLENSSDLVVSGIEAPRIARVGRFFNISVTTLNIGVGLAHGSITRIMFGGQPAGDIQVPDMIPPNLPFVAGFEARCDAGGTFVLEAIADFTDTNPELNETNNGRSISIRCINLIINRTAPTPVITRVPIKEEGGELPQPDQIEVIVEDGQAQDVDDGWKNESGIQLPTAPEKTDKQLVAPDKVE